jgi:hypothetical protein
MEMEVDLMVFYSRKNSKSLVTSVDSKFWLWFLFEVWKFRNLQPWRIIIWTWINSKSFVPFFEESFVSLETGVRFVKRKKLLTAPTNEPRRRNLRNIKWML